MTGDIELIVGRDGTLNLIDTASGSGLPYTLTSDDLDRIGQLSDEVREIIYRAHERAISKEGTPIRKLTRDEVLALPDGANVYVKLTRLYWPRAHVEYEGPAVLYVQTHKGTPVVLALRDHDWAEADPRGLDLQPDGSVVVEDYQMELFEITKEAA